MWQIVSGKEISDVGGGSKKKKNNKKTIKNVAEFFVYVVAFLSKTNQ